MRAGDERVHAGLVERTDPTGGCTPAAAEKSPQAAAGTLIMDRGSLREHNQWSTGFEQLDSMLVRICNHGAAAPFACADPPLPLLFCFAAWAFSGAVDLEIWANSCGDGVALGWVGRRGKRVSASTGGQRAGERPAGGYQ